MKPKLKSALIKVMYFPGIMSLLRFTYNGFPEDRKLLKQASQLEYALSKY